MTKKHYRSEIREIILRILEEKARSKEKIDSNFIYKKYTQICESEYKGLKVSSQRTIERELMEMLNEENALIKREGKKSIKYSLKRPAKKYQIEHSLNLNEENIQTLMLALSVFNTMASDSLRPLIKDAVKAITKNFEGEASKDLEKAYNHIVAVNSIAGRANHTDTKGMQEILFALRNHCAITANYKKMQETQDRPRSLMPIAILFSDGSPYVIAKDLEKKEDIGFQTFKLTRFSNIKVNESIKFKYPNIKNILKPYKETVAGFKGGTKKFTLYGTRELYDHLSEVKIHDSQIVTFNEETKECIAEFNMPVPYPVKRYLAGWTPHLLYIDEGDHYDIDNQVRKLLENGLRRYDVDPNEKN